MPLVSPQGVLTVPILNLILVQLLCGKQLLHWVFPVFNSNLVLVVLLLQAPQCLLQGHHLVSVLPHRLLQSLYLPRLLLHGPPLPLPRLLQLSYNKIVVGVSLLLLLVFECQLLQLRCLSLYFVLQGLLQNLALLLDSYHSSLISLPRSPLLNSLIGFLVIFQLLYFF